jgi:peptide deformylase
MHGFDLHILHTGDERLRTPTRHVNRRQLRTREVQTLIASMVRTLREARGVGLAANQVGEHLSIAVVEDRAESHRDVPRERLQAQQRSPVKLTVLVNPTATVTDNTTNEWFEGCLSIPGMLAIVPRANAVRATALAPDGAPLEIEATGWHARILQHELDHLRGVMYPDIMVPGTLVTREAYRHQWSLLSIEETKGRLRVGEES